MWTGSADIPDGVSAGLGWVLLEAFVKRLLATVLLASLTLDVHGLSFTLPTHDNQGRPLMTVIKASLWCNDEEGETGEPFDIAFHLWTGGPGEGVNMDPDMRPLPYDTFWCALRVTAGGYENPSLFTEHVEVEHKEIMYAPPPGYTPPYEIREEVSEYRGSGCSG